MYKVRPRQPSMQNNEKADSNIAENAVSEVLDGAESMTDYVKPPFVDSA